MMNRFGQVTIHAGNAWSVTASVRGKDLHSVEFFREGMEIQAHCDCDGYIQAPCAHLWASLLAAEKRGFLRGNGGTGAIWLVPLDLDRFPEDEDEDEDDFVFETPHYEPPPKRPPWMQLLDQVNASPIRQSSPESWREDREIYYIIDLHKVTTQATFHVELTYREKLKSGDWGTLKDLRIQRALISQISSAADREIVAILAGMATPETTYGYEAPQIQASYRFAGATPEFILPRMCATGRCRLRNDWKDEFSEMAPLGWDDGEPWTFHLVIESAKDRYLVRGEILRGEERMPLEEPRVLLSEGYLIARGLISRLNHAGAFAWIVMLRKEKSISVPNNQGHALVGELFNSRHLPQIDLPEDLEVEQVAVSLQPCIRFMEPSRNRGGAEKLRGLLSFNYDGKSIPLGHESAGIYDPDARRYIRRDRPAELKAGERLSSLGLKLNSYYYDGQGPRWELAPKKLPAVVQALAKDGWHVEAEGKMFRSASSFQAELTSGIDWFELHGSVSYGDSQVKLPDLLKALDKGETLVRLEDGSYGILPEEFLARYGSLLRFGKTNEDHVRFSRAQTGLLDVFLAEREEIKFDEVFRESRKLLERFSGIEPAAQPEHFVGELRGYQLTGLAWMRFLQDFRWGGCLADDMGVGKTPQVLALLESRRHLGESAGAAQAPSLVVVPRSLVYNWKLEAARFTPKLRVLDHTGVDRAKDPAAFAGYDLVLVTYGTLRRDAIQFRKFQFDYVILDEAQAIKNAASESAKAARLLQAHHRLVMSGTPIENHLGELWSLFEFLNPGMLGGASVFQSAKSALRNPDDATRNLLARAVRPFILRRTKDQVLRELPEKLEQTIYCELDSTQRKLYNELRDFYRGSLLGKIDRQGMAKSKIQILEALLRLRQAACHPGLIDPARKGESSAKLESLLPNLAEVLQEGHKALVFSQFVKMLDIVRAQLDREKISYEYLDGQTRDRQARVDRFQNDPECKLFLISLKAGGVGLNLTAADYVFLLDPWWNPAVESQAIDRTHRIGQTRPVFAYRLIARETVEEKVIELQKSKRDLADAIISQDNRLLGNLKREDLEMLFS